MIIAIVARRVNEVCAHPVHGRVGERGPGVLPVEAFLAVEGRLDVGVVLPASVLHRIL